VDDGAILLLNNSFVSAWTSGKSSRWQFKNLYFNYSSKYFWFWIFDFGLHRQRNWKKYV